MEQDKDNLLYRTYITDGLSAGVENLQVAFGGKAMRGRWYDMRSGRLPSADDRDAEEIKEDIGNQLAMIGES